MNKKSIVKWINFIAFAFVVVGCINWLLVGLFKWDIFGGIFGGMDSTVPRIFYSLFGFAAVWLVTVILIKVFMGGKKKSTQSTQSESK